MRSLNVALRQDLDLYACVRPCVTTPGAFAFEAAGQGRRLIFARTRGRYAGIEYKSGTPGTPSRQFLREK